MPPLYSPRYIQPFFERRSMLKFILHQSIVETSSVYRMFHLYV